MAGNGVTMRAKMRNRAIALLLAPVAAMAMPASAQEAPMIDGNVIEGGDSVFAGDYLIVGIGAAAIPSYDGSDDTAVIPAAGLMGRIGGIGISARAGGIALDLVQERSGARLALNLGPVIRFRQNRSTHIADPVVEKLGKLDGVIEAGVSAGVSFRQVFNPTDSLSIGTDVRWDVSGKGSGVTVSPAVSYFTALSRAQVFGMQVAADFVDDRFAAYNYSVSAQGSAASGLPVYAAQGGLKNIGAGAFTARDLNGNFLDGGFALGVGVAWYRLTGSAADTPVTSLRGTREQWFAGGGLSFTF